MYMDRYTDNGKVGQKKNGSYRGRWKEEKCIMKEKNTQTDRKVDR